ncbi:MAG TPA: DUF4835 family protein [Calditrichaeota bacterium]|nr:DUF4835 family protein [Calditrichota bacterium]
MKTPIILFSILLFVNTALFAQKLNVTVKIQAGHLTEEQRNELEGFNQKIEEYYNNYDYIEDEFEYDVNCNVQIIIETVQQKTFEKIYRAQFLISSETGENFYDKVWEFPYDKNKSLGHSQGQYEPIAQFLDFYAFMVLAGEMDTNGYLLGNALYETAMNIVNQAILSKYSRGWSQRKDYVIKITDIRTRPLREVKPQFFEALYVLGEGNYDQAYKLAKEVLAGIKKVYDVQPNNWYLQMFFNAHYRDLANLFEGKNDELESLINMDGKHRESYREKMR